MYFYTSPNSKISIQMKIFRFLFVFLALVVASSMILINCKSKSGGSGEKAAIESAGPNQLTQSETDEGWILLFDGKTTNGWRGYNKKAFPDSGWVVEDGTLKCLHSGTGEAGFGGDILYDKKFRNFHLKLEWMIEEGGNSGIFYLGQEIPGEAIWYTAPEYQLLDNNSNHPDNFAGKDGNRRAGSLYDLIAPVPQNAKGAMEWNSAEIIVYDGSVFHKMNGETVLEYHLWTPEWKALISGSKFPEFNPDFANVAHEGYICLQDHGHAVWFRNIKLREL
jgi:hypothetical protein